MLKCALRTHIKILKLASSLNCDCVDVSKNRHKEWLLVERIGGYGSCGEGNHSIDLLMVYLFVYCDLVLKVIQDWAEWKF